MAFAGEVSGFVGVEGVAEEKEFIMEMLDGVVKAPSFFTAVGEGPGDADGAHGVKTVGVLDDLRF